MSGPTEEDDEMLAQFYSMSLDELLEASRRTKSRILELLEASRRTKSRILALQQEMEIVSTVLETIKESKQEITPGEASLLGGTHSRGESSLSEEDGGNNDPDSQRQGKSVVVKISERGESSLSEEDGGNNDPDSQRQGKSVVVKISERETIDLPVDECGLGDPGKLKPGDDLSGVDEETLPPEYSSVKAMEVDEKPTENYNDIGGLEKQIQELDEAIVLSLTHKDRFQKSGIRQPKGVLLFGPPGTGKTLIARACAAQTDASFMKLAGAQLVQMDIGGAKLVHDAFQLAKEKSPCIIFIDKIDAIGAKCSDSEANRGSREVERTILEELLSQLDGFSSDDSIKVITTTNCIDILDPALMCSGRLDHKIEIPHPNEEARARILQIHSRTMDVHPNVNFKQLARLTDGFSGAQLKAVCVEAGMVAIRRDATEINHEDFTEGVIQVEAKKKARFN